MEKLCLKQVLQMDASVKNDEKCLSGESEGCPNALLVSKHVLGDFPG